MPRNFQNASIFKIFHKRMWNQAGAVVLLILILPIICEKGPSPTRSNSIDKLSSDDKPEDLTSPRQNVGCRACRMREEIKMRSLQTIKANILNKMGFQTAPNVTGRVLPKIPAHFLAMVEQNNPSGMQSDEPQFKSGPSIAEEEDDFHAKTQKVLSFAQPYPRLRHSWRGHDILHFTLSDNLLKYYVENATLFVYVKGVERRPSPSFHLEVFKVYKNPDHPDSPGTIKVASKRVTQPLGLGDYVKIDVTVMVSEWFKSARDNYGFILNGTVNGRKVIVTDDTDGGTKVPFAEIVTMGAKRRTKRNLVLNCDEKSNQPECCRYPYTINLDKIGMDFVIAPKSYDAYYCAGECDILTLQEYPHTHIFRMASPNNAGPCCAPRKLSPISMLYYDNSYNVLYGSLPGMVVDRCGCS